VLIAALLAARPGAALSHLTAGFLRRILPSMSPYVDVTVPGRHRNRRGLVFHRGVPDAAMLHGLPVTSAARTLRDLAATLPLPDLERACSEALILGIVTTTELAAQQGHGSGVLRKLVADDLAPAQSELERRFRRLARAHGLPRPESQVRIAGHRADFVFPAERLVVEVDGFRFHGNRIAAERDRADDAELQLAGYAVLRFTWRQVRHEPALVAARIARALSARAMRRAS
jgi:very-short-patch-repair endonuclease